MQTSDNVFNTIDPFTNKDLVNRATEVQTTFNMEGHTENDSVFHTHDAQVGFLQQDSSGLPFTRHFHTITPTPFVMKDSERNMDLTYENNSVFQKAEDIQMESNYELDMNFYNVAFDGTRLSGINTSAAIQEQNKRERLQQTTQVMLSEIARVYNDSNSGEQDRRRVINQAVGLQSQLVMVSPDLSNTVGQVLSNYVNSFRREIKPIVKKQETVEQSKTVAEKEKQERKEEVKKIPASNTPRKTAERLLSEAGIKEDEFPKFFGNTDYWKANIKRIKTIEQKVQKFLDDRTIEETTKRAKISTTGLLL
jgi:hypothetical protein